jgi:hypothetical protein
MPFFIAPPPAFDLPKTVIEYNQNNEENNELDVAKELRALELDEDLFESVYIRDKFDSLVKSWESNTLFESSVSKIISDPSFRRILNMGEKAIPFIIEEIDNNPSTLVWALNIITNSSFETSTRITVSEACKLWVKKWKKAVR